MDRLEALNKLPELSAGCLDADQEEAVRRWVEECPRCKAEWSSLEAFVKTLHSVPPAPLTEARSRQMWARCSSELFEREQGRSISHAPLSGAQRSSLSGWARSQPRWGWAMLGGAVLVLGGAILAPDTSPSQAGAPSTLASVAVDSDPGELQSLGRPPSYAATMVDHHAQMAADPFSDRVGSSLVSYSASSEGQSP